MSKKEIEIKIGSKKFTAELLEKEAPKLSRKVWEYLEKPLESNLVHAKFAGGELLFMLPRVLEAERENSVKVFETKPGYVCNYPPRQLMLLFYGECIKERVDVDVFAKVHQDQLDDLVSEGRKVWLQPAGKIVMKRKE